MKKQSALAVALLAVACLLFSCGNGESSDSGGNDASSDTSDMDTSENCSEDEWVRGSDMSCQPCPAEQLTCASIDTDATSIDSTEDQVVVTLQEGLTELSSATLETFEAERICQGGGGGGGEGENCDNITEAGLSVSGEVDGNTVTFNVLPANEGSNWIQVNELVLIDACGQENTITLRGSWHLGQDTLGETVGCQ